MVSSSERALLRRRHSSTLESAGSVSGFAKSAVALVFEYAFFQRSSMFGGWSLWGSSAEELPSTDMTRLRPTSSSGIGAVFATLTATAAVHAAWAAYAKFAAPGLHVTRFCFFHKFAPFVSPLSLGVPRPLAATKLD